MHHNTRALLICQCETPTVMRTSFSQVVQFSFSDSEEVWWLSIWKKPLLIPLCFIEVHIFYLLDIYLCKLKFMRVPCFYWKVFFPPFPPWVRADLQLFHSLPLNASYIRYTLLNGVYFPFSVVWLSFIPHPADKWKTIHTFLLRFLAALKSGSTSLTQCF